MRKVIILLVLLLAPLSIVVAQTTYKIELQYNITNTNNTGDWYFNSTPYNGTNFPLGTALVEADFSGPGTKQVNVDNVFTYSRPITNFRYFSSGMGCDPFGGGPQFASFSGSQCTFVNIGFSTCLNVQPGFDPNRNVIFEIKDFATENAGSGNIGCNGKNIIVSDACGFKYRLYAVYQGAEIDILDYGYHPGVYTLQKSDLPTIPLGQPFALQVEYVNNPSKPTDTSSLLTSQTFVPCPPELDSTVNPNPDPISPTCVGDSDGGFDVTFDRVLRSDEQMTISVHPGTTDPTIIESRQNLRASDFTNLTYRFLGTLLPAGSYRMSYIVGPITPGAFPVVDGTDGFFTITNPVPVTFTQSSSNASCAGTADGSITVNPQGGTAPYQFLLTPDGGTETTFTTSPIQGLVDGNYSLRVRDDNGCFSNSQSIAIQATSSEPVLNTATTIVNQLNEAPLGQASIILGNITGGNGTYTYAWTRSPDNGFGTVTSDDLTSLTEGGVYSLVITSGSCTSQTYQFTINDVLPLTVNFSTIGEANCEGDTATIQAQGQGGTGGYSYTWSTGATTQSINVAPGTYSVTVSDGSGTITTDSFTLNYVNRNDGSIISNVLSVSVTNVTNILCRGTDTGAIDLTISGGSGNYEVFWDGSFTASTEDRTDLSAGPHYYLVRDSNDCEVTNFTNQITIIEPSVAFEVTATSTNATSNGGNQGTISLTLSNGAGGYNYVWTKDGLAFTPPAGSTDTEIIGLQEGIYQVVITDANGCVATLLQPVTITEPGPLELQDPQFVMSPVDCFGASTGSITAQYNGTPPFNFIWRDSGNNIVKSGPDDFLDNQPVGFYTYTIADATTATALTSNPIEITQPLAGLTASLTQTEVTCFGGDDGTITVNTSGGTAPYQYAISGGFATQITPGSFADLSAGTYTITVTDVNSCTITIPLTTTLTQPEQITIDDTNAVTPVSTAGATDGSITVAVQGGAQPYFYRWSGPITLSPINTANTTTIENLPEGVYTLEVSNKPTFDIDGCYLTKPYTVGVTAPQGINTSVTNVNCKGEATGAIDATIIGETPNSYQWTFADDSAITTSNGTTTEDISGLLAGTYVLTITYADAATFRSADIEITEPADEISAATPVSTNVTCNGGNDGSITVTASGGTAPLTYSLDEATPQASGLFENLQSGSYIVTVIDANNCTLPLAAITITQPDPVTFINNQTSIQAVSTNGGTDGSITAVVQGGSTPYFYQWSSNGTVIPETSNILSGLTQGTYTLRVSNTNAFLVDGCYIERDFLVTEPGPLSISNIVTVDVDCRGSASGSIGTTVIGEGNITYAWTLDGGATIPISNGTDQPNISGIGAGTYVLTVTDDNQTISSNPITINEPAEEITATTPTSTDVTCNGGNDGSISITASGGTAPLRFSLDGGVTSQDNNLFENLQSGSYIVTVIDANDCTLPLPSITITQPDPVTFINNQTSIQAVSTNGGADGSITAVVQGGSTPYFYQWSSNGTVLPETSNILSGLSQGNYTLRVSNTNAFLVDGCYIERIFNVPEPGPLSISNIVTVDVDCRGSASGSIGTTVIGEGNITYAWTLDGGATIPISNGTDQPNISGIGAGTYVLTVTDDNETISSNPIAITEPAEEITATTPVGINITCNGGNDGSISITASGGTAPLTFSINNASAQTSNIFENLQSGSYVVTVIDANNCTLSLPAITITEPNPVTFIDNQTSIQAVSTNGGADGSITAAVQGGSTPYFYQWSSNGTVLPETSNILSGLTQGNYTLRVSNTNAFLVDGCYIERVFNVPEPGPISINNIVTVNVDCKGNASGSIGTTVIGEGNITYAWTLDGGAPIPVSNGTDQPNISGIGAGTYVLTVTDNNQTISSNPITITEPAEELLISAITATDANCFGENSGSIAITASGGTAPYEYSIDDGITYQNQNAFANLPTGSYTVRVRDFNGCAIVEPGATFINQPQELVLTVTNQQSLSSAGASDGEITVAVTGGTGTLQYNWAGPGTFDRTNPSISGLEGGEYTVTVTDALGCTLISDPITIAEPGVLTVTSNQTVFLSCNGDDFAEIEAFPNGGVSPYSYEWFQVVNGNNNLLIEDTGIIANLSAGTYFVRITDANSISADGNPVVITEPTTIQITLDSKIDVLCASEETGALNISVTGGTAPYSYVWSSGQSVQDISNLPAGTYTIEVGDANMCFNDATFEITSPADALQITNASLTDVSSYQGSDGSISLDISGGATPYTINWTRLSDNTSAGSQATISNLSADTYQVLITDANGCSITEPYEITQPDIVEDTIVPPTCNGESNGSISVIVNEGNGSFTYAWSTGATTNTISNLAAGSYSVTITGFGNGPLTRTYELEDPLPIEVDLGVDRVLCANQILELDATVEDETASYLWSSDTGFSSVLPNVTLTESGNYTVLVTSQTGCTVEGNISVEISTDEIEAEFAISSQVFQGEEVVAVDISFPLPESIVWQIPEGATVLTQNSDELVLTFESVGEYEIGLTTTFGDCIANKTKKVIVVQKDPLTEEDKTQAEKVIEDFILYPNPTTGRFTADVSLSERGNVSLKVFNFANNMMMASERASGDSSYSIPFDISGMPTGVYAVVLETPYGTSLRKIVVR